MQNVSKFYHKIAILVFWEKNWKPVQNMQMFFFFFWNITQANLRPLLLKTPKSFKLQTSRWSRNMTWVIRGDQLSKKILNFLMICKNLWSVRTDFQGIHTFHSIFQVLATYNLFVTSKKMKPRIHHFTNSPI